MRRVAVFICLALFIGADPALAKGRKVKGFITEINGDKTRVEIWRNEITIPSDVEFEIKDNERELRVTVDDLRLGMHVSVRGEYEKNKYLLTAKKITVDADQFENKVKRTAYLYREIEGLMPEGDGWVGTVFLDGQRIYIRPETELLFKLNRVEKKLEKKAKKEARNDDEFDDEDSEEVDQFDPLKSPKDVRPGDICEYTGSRNEDGSINATRLVFRKNDREKNEAKLFKKLKLKEKEADEDARKRGSIKVGRYKFKTYYDERLRDYVSDVGDSLIPEYQHDLEESDGRRIDFRFVVIDGQKSPNAFAFPNGIVGINTAMLLMLENEAQLAFVLGHEIAHATNEHTYRQMMFHRKKRMALAAAGIAAAAFGYGYAADIITLTAAAITNGYQRFLEDQSDRYGLRFAADRGYNPLQSVQVWINMRRNFGGGTLPDFFWSSHSSHTERISYLLVEVRNNFADLTPTEFSSMEMDRKRYIDMTALMREDPKLQKLRKRMQKYRQRYDEEEGLLKH